MELYASCSKHLERKGVVQWNEHYPNTKIVTEDIKQGTIFAYRGESHITGIITLDEDLPEEFESITWADSKAEKVLVIHRLAVDPQLQGKGIAAKLIDFAESYAKEHQYSSIRLDCFSQNQRAYHFYEKMNFVHRGLVVFPHSSVPFHCFEKLIDLD